MKDITTIKLDKETKERLTRLKEHERETYNQVIRKVLYVLNKIRKDPVSANRILQKIDNNIRRKKNYFKETKSLKTEQHKEEYEK